MPVSVTKMSTGYPNFGGLKDKPTADQIKLVWDVLHQLSKDLSAVADAVNLLDSRVTACESRLTAGGL